MSNENIKFLPLSELKMVRPKKERETPNATSQESNCKIPWANWSGFVEQVLIYMQFGH